MVKDKEFLLQIVVGDDEEDVLWEEYHFYPQALLARMDEWMRHIKVRLYEEGQCFAEADAYTLLDMKMVDGMRKALGMRQSALEEEGMVATEEEEAAVDETEEEDQEVQTNYWGWCMPPAAALGYWAWAYFLQQPIPFGKQIPPLTKGTLGPDNVD